MVDACHGDTKESVEEAFRDGWKRISEQVLFSGMPRDPYHKYMSGNYTSAVALIEPKIISKNIKSS